MEHKWSTVKLEFEMNDQVKCSCGWESQVYFDGFEYALDEWRKHIKEQEGGE